MLDLRNWFDSLEVGQLGTQCSHGLRLLCLPFEIYFGATNKPIDRNLNSARLDCLCLLQQCVRPCLEEVHAHSGACLQRLFHSLFLVGFLCWAKLQFNNLRGDILSDSLIKHILDLNPIFLLSIRCEVTQQSLNLRVGQSLPGHRHSPRWIRIPFSSRSASPSPAPADLPAAEQPRCSAHCRTQALSPD